MYFVKIVFEIQIIDILEIWRFLKMPIADIMEVCHQPAVSPKTSSQYNCSKMFTDETSFTRDNEKKTVPTRYRPSTITLTYTDVSNPSRRRKMVMRPVYFRKS